MLATDKGLRRIEGDSWYDLTVADGLPSNSIWCIVADDQDHLWIGTESGIVRYKPPTNHRPPAVKIKRVDGKKAEDKVYVTGRSYVTIDWYGGDVQSPNDRLLFQYSIDRQWSEMFKQNTATIGLQNGEHQFSIRAIDHHFNTSAVDSMTIIVRTERPDLNFSSPTNGDILSRDKST